MIKLTDIIYYGNGFVATFDDNSVANARFKVVNGKLIAMGLNKLQKTAIDAFNDTFTSLNDLRFQGKTITTTSVGSYTQIASGVIATGTGPTDVLTLIAGKEYLVYVANSDNGGALLVSADVVPGAATVLAVTGSSATIVLSTYSFFSAAAQSAAKVVQLLATGSASEQLTQLSAEGYPGPGPFDSTTLTIRQDGDIEARHINGGAGTNGAWIIYEK